MELRPAVAVSDANDVIERNAADMADVMRLNSNCSMRVTLLARLILSVFLLNTSLSSLIRLTSSTASALSTANALDPLLPKGYLFLTISSAKSSTSSSV